MQDRDWDDFLPTIATTLPTLSVLDDRCRCSVCKDYLQGPMMTLCGHTFCSLCIRRALNADGRCPSCRSLEEESKLRKNLMIEEIVEAFLPFRDSLMKYAPATDATDVPETAQDDDFAEQPNLEEPDLSARTTRSSRVTRAVANRLNTTTTSESRSREPTTDLVACPICARKIQREKADAHANRCIEGKASPPPSPSKNGKGDLGGQSRYFVEESPGAESPNQTSTPSKVQQPPTMHRMAKLTYSALTDVKLRQKMAELGISTAGPRQQLQRRCTEYIAIWNSNLDSKQPKSKRELLQDLRAWDRAQAKPVTKFSNDEIDEQTKDGKFDDNFNDLIQQAKESMKKKRKNAETAANGTEPSDAAVSETNGHTAIDGREVKRQHIEI